VTYSLCEVAVEVSLSPKISASFITAEALADEDTERVEKAHDARKLQSSRSVGGLRLLGLSIGIGLSPSVTIKFG
jgi:hypothetical protein